MSNLTRAFLKLWWVPAIIVVSSCAPQKYTHLRGVVGDLSMSQISSGGSGILPDGPTGGGTTGGNPNNAGREQTADVDPNGDVSEIAVCIDLASLKLLDTGGKTVIPLSVDGAKVDPIISLRKKMIEFRIVGLPEMQKFVGAVFNFMPGCGFEGRSLVFRNRSGSFEFRDVLTLNLSGSASMTNGSLAVTLNAGGLINALAAVTDSKQIPGVIANLGAPAP